MASHGEVSPATWLEKTVQHERELQPETEARCSVVLDADAQMMRFLFAIRAGALTSAAQLHETRIDPREKGVAPFQLNHLLRTLHTLIFSSFQLFFFLFQHYHVCFFNQYSASKCASDHAAPLIIAYDKKKKEKKEENIKAECYKTSFSHFLYSGPRLRKMQCQNSFFCCFFLLPQEGNQYQSRERRHVS